MDNNDNIELLVHVTASATVQADKRALALAQAIYDFRPRSATYCDDYSSPPLNDESPEVPESLRDSSAAHISALLANENIWTTPSTLARPRTAPAATGSTIQVPYTSSERGRASSEPVRSIKSSWISNSHDEAGNSDDPVSSPMAGRSRRLVFDSSPDHMPAAKRVRLDAGDGDFAAVSQSRDWAADPGEALHSSGAEASTITASQHSVELAHESRMEDIGTQAASIVTLSSDSSQAPTQTQVTANRPQSPEVALFPAIDELPSEVNSAHPPVGGGSYTTHITEPLRDLHDSLASKFRPLKATRDVQVLERGHWLMNITVAGDQHVEVVRRSPTKQSRIEALNERFSGATAEEKLAKFWQARSEGNATDYDYGHEDTAVGKWTESEFLLFWEDMSSFISAGKAGWAVRMSRDKLKDGGDTGGSQQYRVRVFGWGEILMHLYLAVYLCSSKASIFIPMRWVGGNGATIVEMSGKKKFRGDGRHWVRKGRPGSDGVWGLGD
jgi:hypothetical protein